MTRKNKSLDEQLADARERQRQTKARIDALETRRRQKDNKLRGKGRMVLMRVMLDRMTMQPGFRNVIADLVKVTPLRPDELEAVEWLMASLDPPAAATPAPALIEQDRGERPEMQGVA